MKKVMETTMSTKAMDKAVGAIMEDVASSKSSKMKALFNLGLTVKAITEMMGVRYNFVYNVVSNMVIVEGVQIEATSSESKKDVVFALLDQGKTVKEIAVELKTNMNYIYKLRKEWEVEVAKEAAKLEAEAQVAVGQVETTDGGTK